MSDAVARLAATLIEPGAALLLDMDGTLVNSEPAHRAAFRRYFAERGWPLPAEVLAAFGGRRAADVFAALDGPWAGEDGVALAAAVTARLDLVADPPVPVPGAADAIRGWHAAGMPIAVVTSAGRAWTQHVLDLLEVGDLGLTLVTAEDTPTGKPDPAPYALAVRRLGADAAACLAAEDTPAGLTAARGAGVGHLLGMTTSAPPEALLDAGAHATAPDLTALAAAARGVGTDGWLLPEPDDVVRP
ncbi:HAD family phosphatase [Georgenia sp. TF02-10]|uniref:HAD family hydrolase n=1 Tax=Georgenia sp. TF02-10 TaxID=2917725 RepID=UPI001FA74297|nr:HAD family phosphatase [Georgenia sp. TF02-10]UNX55836.1 HAD family phosphatase [Georgenia sp. TF02-10]